MMDDLSAPFGSSSAASTHARRQRSRGVLRKFYGSATPDDAASMDSLLFAHARLEEALMTCRSHLLWPARMTFERMCNDFEQNFLAARDRVHHCASFQQLSLSEQTRIVILAFQVRMHVATE